MKNAKNARLPLLAAALLAAPLGAHAASEFDAYYTPYAKNQLENTAIGDVNFDNGDGWGLRTRFGLGTTFFLSGEYGKNQHDDINIGGSPLIPGSSGSLDLRTEQYRAGLGAHLATTPFHVRAEYIGYESRTRFDNGVSAVESDTDKQEGWGAHLGAQGKVLSERLTLTSEIGYVAIGDADGLEALAGGAVNFTPRFAVFADYRYTSLAGDSGHPDLRADEARVGARLTF